MHALGAGDGENTVPPSDVMDEPMAHMSMHKTCAEISSTLAKIKDLGCNPVENSVRDRV